MIEEFNKPSDELKIVAEEISLLRNDLHTTLSSLDRIERRLRATFQDYPTKKKIVKEPKNGNSRNSSSKTPQELQAIFNELMDNTEKGGDKLFLSSIEKLSEEDIIALSVELGIGSPSHLSKRKSVEGIRKRIQEAIMLQFKKKEGA